MSKKYLVLYKSSASAGEQMGTDPGQAEAGMALWMEWMQKCGPALVDPGSPVAEATELPSSGANSGRYVGGYSILQGESLAEIEKMLEGHPHFHAPAASIELLEFLAVPGMS